MSVNLHKRPLYDFQRDVLYYTGNVAHPAPLLQMRLGKTLITTRRLLAPSSHTTQVLIVAPYAALRGWEDELVREGVHPSDIGYLAGPKIERQGKLHNRSAFSLINKEGFLALPEIAQVPWSDVVCDESTFLKNPQSKVSAFFCKNFRKVKRRWILTGTPAPESDLDLFQQLRFLDPSILGLKNYWEFRFHFFEQPRPYEWTISKEGHNWLQERLKKSCYVLSRKDAGMDVRQILVRRIVELPPSVRKTYTTAEKEFVLELHGKEHDRTIYAMEKYSWLKRLCGGIIEKHVVHTAKIDELLELMRGELKHEQVVIWCQYIDELTTVKGALDRAHIKTEIIHGEVKPDQRYTRIHRFQLGKVQVLLGHPSCFKYAIDLSCCDTIIDYSLPEGSETYDQSGARLEHITKKTPTFRIALIVKDSVDEDIYEGIQRKETRQEILHRMMKRREA